jgi:hypothetical protein
LPIGQALIANAIDGCSFSLSSFVTKIGNALTGVNVPHSTQRNLRAAGISHLCQRGDQSRQPTNQVITFPQISAISASTSRPIRTLRPFKPFSRFVIAKSPIRLDDFHEGRISFCATSNRPIQMMSGK